jgi:phosphohistidine swiveling domain-containing protein
MIKMPLEERINGVKNWLIMNSGVTPYIVAFGLRQWIDLLYKQYPENVLMSFGGGRMSKLGSESQFAVDYEEYRSSFLKLLNDLRFLEKVYSDFLVAEKNFIAFNDLVLKNGEEYLNDNFDEFIRVYDAEYIPGVVPDGVLVYGAEFFNEMKEKYPAYEKEIRTLVESYGETFISRFRQELLKSAMKYGNLAFETVDEMLANAGLKSDLENIQRSFHWLKNNYKNVAALPVSFFAEQLLEIMKSPKIDYEKEGNELKDYPARHKRACDEIKNSGVFDAKDYEKLLWLGKIAWWVDRRKEYNLIANYYLGKHLEFLCRKHHLNYDDAIFLLPWELDDVISGKKKMDDYPTKDRQVECVYFRDIFGQELFLSGAEAKALWEKISPPLATGETNEVKGMTAFKGKVKGIARVVMDAHNPGEFNDGDILVTGMTRPDFLSLMKKSAAFVTDEGGITCHAAIVARELKKPCVIGTKIATKIFKSGDLVEVDAETGIVRKIQ